MIIWLNWNSGKYEIQWSSIANRKFLICYFKFYFFFRAGGLRQKFIIQSIVNYFWLFIVIMELRKLDSNTTNSTNTTNNNNNRHLPLIKNLSGILSRSSANYHNQNNKQQSNSNTINSRVFTFGKKFLVASLKPFLIP